MNKPSALPRRKNMEDFDRITAYVKAKTALTYKIGKAKGFDTPKMVREAIDSAMEKVEMALMDDQTV